MSLTRGEKLTGRKRGPGRQAPATAAPTADEVQAGQSRLMTAASQLHDRAADTRMLGVRALAQLADESAGLRQQCINVLCAAVREHPNPFPEGRPEPGDARLRAYRDDRALRQAIIGTIASRLRPDARVSWRGCDLDFTGAIFDGDHPAAAGDECPAVVEDERAPAGDAAAVHGQPPSPPSQAGPPARASLSFEGARFTGGKVSFARARFCDGLASFAGARFTGGEVSFAGAEFAGGKVSFAGAQFTGATVNFARARFSGADIVLTGAEFTGGQVSFAGAEFADGKVSAHARFHGGQVAFLASRFTGGLISFVEADFAGSEVEFLDAEFSGGKVGFVGATFSGGEVSFVGATFSGGEVSFTGSSMTGGEISFTGAAFNGAWVRFAFAKLDGGEIRFPGAKFGGGDVNFRQARFGGADMDFTSTFFSGGRVDLSEVTPATRPPTFDDWASPPQGLLLPATAFAARDKKLATDES